jgi:DNA-binding CsgD family transcriptional regulator
MAFEDGLLSCDAVIERFLEETADIFGTIGSCWHETDPASGTPFSSSAAGDPAGSFGEAMDYEFRRSDVNSFSSLRIRRRPASAISVATQGQMSVSLRFREMIAPAGPADELRISFTDASGTWAAFVAFTNRRMTPEDLRFAGELIAPTTDALRGATAAQMAQTHAGPSSGGELGHGPVPSVLIIDPQDRIIAADAAARRRLALLGGHADGGAPGLISFLAAKARWGPPGEPATSRMRTPDGQWLIVDASLLEDDESRGSVAIVMRPAPAGAVLDSVLRSLGLSEREREVAGLVAQGQSTKSIAAELVLSPWTVADHLKAIYAKAAVNGRSGLVALAGPAAGRAV